MDHDVSAHASPSSYSHSREPSSGFALDPAAAAAAAAGSALPGSPALSLQDYLVSMMSPSALTASLPQFGSGYDGYGSPADHGSSAPVNFADILADFTAQNALSPEASGLLASQRGADGHGEGASPLPGAPAPNGPVPDAEANAAHAAPTPGRSAQEVLLEQLKALYPAASAAGAAPAAPERVEPPKPSSPLPPTAPGPGPSESHPSPLGHQQMPYAASPAPSNGSGAVPIAPDMQAQLQQWLSQSLAGFGALHSSQTPTPTGFSPVNNAHSHPHPPQNSGYAHSQHSQHPQQHQQQHPSPHGYPPQQSPVSANFAHTHSAPSSQQASPMPQYIQGSRDHQYPASGPSTPHNHHPAQQSNPYPQGGMAASALPPHMATSGAGSSAGDLSVQAQISALQLLVNANAQAQAQARAQGQSLGAPESAHAQYGQPQQQQHHEQQHTTPLQQASNPQTPFDMRMSAPGTANSSYRETDYMFSPLMSPAMTPHSAFTNASSLPPSVGPAPLVAPSDCFPPLTSPALGPQMYGTDQHQQHRNSLQGLVDGVGALSTQLPPGSPANAAFYSPRAGSTDSTAAAAGAGSSRRGASSARSKTRPSPLIKPTDATHERRRRKTQSMASSGVAASEKRAQGSKSATSSPYIEGIGHFTSERERASSAFSGASSSHAAGSPGEGGSVPSADAHTNGSNASAASIDTPSPVDLAVAHQHQPLVAPGLRESATVAHAATTQAGTDGSMGPPPAPSSTSLNPITPASFMNFASDFDMNGLSSLSPSLDAVQVPQHFDPTSSALSSLQNSPALLPQSDHSQIAPPSIPVDITEETFRAPPQPSASGKASRVRKTPSARASPALKPVDAKGKGKASAEKSAATSARRGSAASKPAKIAPSPKIGPTRGSVTPDTLRGTRGNGASKDQNEDRDVEIDVLGLPPSVTSDSQADKDAKDDMHPDNRRSSHKVAEQKRRDSLKLCFDELRRILPPILPYTDEQDRRPGDGNVGGQRHGEIDPVNPNKGVSKVALLRRSNEYLGILRERIDRRDRAISSLRSQLSQLREQCGLGDLGQDEEEVPGLELDLDNMDKEEKRAGNLAFYEDLDFDEKVARGEISRQGSASRRSSMPAEPKPSRAGTRRSKRQQAADEMDLEL